MKAELELELFFKGFLVSTNLESKGKESQSDGAITSKAPCSVGSNLEQ